jgi:hypothetical protein
LPPYISEGVWVNEGVEKFSRYFGRKGWFVERSEDGAVGDVVTVDSKGVEASSNNGKTWTFSEGGLRIVLEVATAWAVTKALLPARLVLSVWATPWFARVCVLPVTRWTGRVFGKGKHAASGAAGTGAIGGSNVSKTVTSAAKKKVE